MDCMQEKDATSCWNSSGDQVSGLVNIKLQQTA